MEYVLIKGAGLDNKNLSALMVSRRNTANPLEVANNFYGGSELTLADKKQFSSDIEAIPANVPIFTWNSTGYEYPLLFPTYPSFVSVLKYRSTDLFKLIQIGFNRMVSFYKILRVGADRSSLSSLYKMDELGMLVKEIPQNLRSGNTDCVSLFLDAYLNGMSHIVNVWATAGSLCMECATRTGNIYVELKDIFDEIDQYIFRRNAISNIPHHCLTEVFRET